MGIYSLITKYFGRTNPTTLSPAALFYPDFAWTDLPQPEIFKHLIDADNSLIYILSNINATAVASIPLRLYAQIPKQKKSIFDGEVIDKATHSRLSKNYSTYKYLSRSDVEIVELFEHPFLDLMKNVNPHMNQHELFDLSQKFEELTGNSYWYVLKNNLGLPMELWIVPSQDMRIVPDPQDFVKGYLYNNGIKEEFLPVEDIIHHKTPSPISMYYGRGPFAPVVTASNINTLMHTYEEALFKNMARPSLAVEVKNRLNKDQARQFKKTLKQSIGGAKKGGDILVIDNEAKVSQISWSPKDMNVLLEGKPIKEELAAAFGVPMSMLGTDDVNLANAQAGRVQHAEKAIEPRLRRKEQKINEKLLPMWDDRLFCAFDDSIPENRELSLKENTENVKAGIWTRNEVRLSQGKEPIEGADELQISSSGFGGIIQDPKYVADLLTKELDKELKKLYADEDV